MIFNKKGISPAAATLILIAFAIALGAVVMTWGKSYIEEKAEFVGEVEVSGCGTVSFDIIKVGGAYQACYDVSKDSLELLLENGDTADLLDMQVRVIGDQGIYMQDSLLSNPLLRTHSVKRSVPYGNIGRIQQVKITPVIEVAGSRVVCGKRSLILEKELRVCS